MVMDWFLGSKAASVNELIIRKDYAKAIELISAELEKNARNERLRLQLAHVLALAGRKAEAGNVLERLADDLAGDGFGTKAVAVLKKMQKIDPARSGIDERLAALIGSRPAPAAGAWVEDGALPEIAIGFAEPAPVGVTEGGELVPPPERPGPAPSKPASLARGSGALATPLFRGMSQEEIVAVIRGIRLLGFGPGQIVVTEGEPGDSLFVVTTGLCRAFVRSATGRNVEVRQLSEGEFFGEISILTGQPRTATITTATPSELLELSRESLDSIIRTHPRVRQVLEEFHARRADSTIEAAIRGLQGK
jgi:cAMP-dependent protein kinase regulator